MNADDDEIPQELLLGKHQLSELSSESAKIKAMGIMHKVGTGSPLSTGEVSRDRTQHKYLIFFNANCFYP